MTQQDRTHQHASKSALPSIAVCSAVIIANPTSGNYLFHTRQIDETVAFLRGNGWDVELCLTEKAGDARRLARLAVEQEIEVVIAAGGDGTINEIIQELVGSETALGVLPVGTVNVWARETNIPLDDVGARKVLVDGRRRRVDLGKVNDRYFLLMAGIGFDAEVAHAVEKKPIKRLGVVGYLLIGTWLGLGYESFRTYLTVNGRLIKKDALQIIIGNTQLYGGTIKYTWQAQCDDGQLDVCVVRKRNMLGRVIIFIDFLLHREQRHQWVTYAKSDVIEVRTRQPVAIQVDGDPSGFTPAKFTVAPQALKVIVPHNASMSLFSQE
ncbi:MAG: diacylglycerol/lipid kinase family protein [Ktedonobacteraceae bacterium]